jgi:hypothetical protein
LVFRADRDGMREASGELGVLAEKAGDVFSPNAKLDAVGDDGEEGLIGGQGANGDDDEFAVVIAHVLDPVECHDELKLWAVAGLVPGENKLSSLERMLEADKRVCKVLTPHKRHCFDPRYPAPQ